MAALDELLSRIEDKALRTEILREIKLLRAERELGLVFERHLPERVRLNGLKIRKGNAVEIREDDASPVWSVKAIQGDTATIERRDDNGTNISEAHSVEGLVVVREFGQPIYPGLKSVGRIENGGDKSFHMVVNAENFHALETLVYTHAQKIDLVLIDPPYNTGAKDWKYNNNYVDENDAYRHSKWLSFMEKRLQIASKLLKPDGILIVTIDEYEANTLGLLLKDLFPSSLHYSLSIVINSRGSTGTRNFGVIDEKALFVVPDMGIDLISSRESFPGLLKENEMNTDDDDSLDQSDEVSSPAEAVDDVVSDAGEYWTTAYRTGAATSYRKQRPNQFYPIFIDAKKQIPVRVGEPLLPDSDGRFPAPYLKEVDGLIPLWPIDENGDERVWAFVSSRMQVEIEKGNLKLGRFNAKRNTWAIKVRRVKKNESRLKERTVWWDARYDGGANGTSLLTGLLGRAGSFPFPKSLYTMTDLIAVCTAGRPNAVILDFFAGSGTTMHATGYLNQLDGGRRTSICITNNEVAASLQAELRAKGLRPGDEDWESHGIFQQATKPRCEAAVTGIRPDGKPIEEKVRYKNGTKMSNGLAENIEFFELTYEDPDHVRLGAAFEAVSPLLWMKAGSTGPRISKVDEKWIIPDSATYGVLFDADYWSEFVLVAANAKNLNHLFVVTDSDAVYQKIVGEVPGSIEVVRLYESYLRSFAINKGVNS